MLCLAISACSAPFLQEAQTPTHPPLMPLEFLVPLVTITPTEAQCAFVEGRQALPDISRQLQDKLTAASLPVNSSRAEAYGENCIAADGSLVRFAARETDYYVSFKVSDLHDETILGTLIERAVSIIEQFPINQTPGPNPGYIGIRFEAEGNVQNLWFLRSTFDDLISRGTHGADLYASLRGNP